MISKFKSFIRLLTLAIFLTTLLGIATDTRILAAEAADLSGKSFRYSVNFRGSDAGELEVIIEKTTRGYLVKSISHLSVLAQLFLKSTTTESEFSQQGENLTLLSGREISNETGEVQRSFNIDHQNSRILFADGGEVPFNKGTPIQAESFPLSLMLSEPMSWQGKDYLSINPKRVRNFKFETISTESLEVPAGKFTAFLLQSVRPDEPARRINIWLNEQSPHVPIKIITGKSGKQTVLELLK